MAAQTTCPGDVPATKSMNKNNGGYASLSGQAVDTEEHLFKIVPDIGISFERHSRSATIIAEVCHDNTI